MNTQAIARALRLLADAIETPATALAPATPTAPSNVATAAPSAEAPKRGPGRPPKPAQPAAPSAPAPAASTTPPVAAAAGPAPASGLTHAIVANDFKAAALAHGRDFVKGLLTAHGAPTFDKVKDLATFQAQLKAGPVKFAVEGTTIVPVDGTDLLG